MISFSRNFWKRSAKKNGLFENIPSQEKIQALDKKNKAQEKKEFDAFEKGFDEELKKLG